MEIQIIFDKHQKFVAIIKNKTLQYIFLCYDKHKRNRKLSVRWFES